MTRILLVDDQSLVRAGFTTILESEDGFEVVGHAADGVEAVRLAEELNPDVICMDVQMPNMDGLEATRRIVSGPSTAAVLMLTTFDRDDFLFESLSAGASGFLLKTADPDELVEAVHVLDRGDALLSPQVTRRVIERFGDVVAEPAGPGAAVIADPASALSVLTDRERATLMLLARGMSNAEIAGELFVGEATVKTHVSNILMKLGIRDRIHAVIWAYEQGVIAPSAS
ncbi:MAG: response regulator [Agrococcus casei]|uniref:response regulator n=1 Tax=Agrococcus casei TaxID=343512 RepID=UPI003F8EBA9D